MLLLFEIERSCHGVTEGVNGVGQKEVLHLFEIKGSCHVVTEGLKLSRLCPPPVFDHLPTCGEELYSNFIF